MACWGTELEFEFDDEFEVECVTERPGNIRRPPAAYQGVRRLAVMRRALALVLAVGLQAALLAAPPARLSDESYADVRKHVALSAVDLRFQQLDWHDSVIKGVQQAQREDKPLLLWLYFGDPRGNC